MNLIFLEEAFAEMVESARFYEEKSEGLGADFLYNTLNEPAEQAEA